MALQISHTAKYLLVRTDNLNLNDSEAKGFVAAVQAQPETQPMIIFDMLRVDSFVDSALRILARGMGAAYQQNAKVILLVKKDLKKVIHESGLERILPCYESLSEIVPGEQEPAGPKEQALIFLNTTLETVPHTLKVSANMQSKALKSFIRGQGKIPPVDIGATVGIVSIPFTGALTIAFPMPTFLKIMSGMVGVEYKTYDPEINSGAAELLNIILGQAKISLNEKGFGLKQAIPSVIHGTDFQISSPSAVSIIIPFESDAGSFFVEFVASSIK